LFNNINPWIFFGLFGQCLFGARFLVQWIVSERRKESTIPILFWYFSLSGGLILLIYAIYRKDPVFIAGQSMGLVIYIRNLRLINKKNKSEKAILAGDASAYMDDMK
jgi:lipid-A-disaccharide synthase-like uncharacterized protein